MPAPALSVAPMMERTDRHFRWFVRRITRRTLLYTEMITARAILHGDAVRLLAYDPSEHPLALQLGGDDPRELAVAARIAEDFGYDELNLNVGCPSERVASGNFGACLMRTPELVADLVAAMRDAVRLEVTVKHRIGVDELDRYEDMLRFVDVVAAAGCRRFTVHARKAWLNGLSPKENRTIPPLRYEDVYRLKRERPDLEVEINGGVRNLDEAERHLAHVDAVMIGRAAYDDPMLFADADRRLLGAPDAPVADRVEVALALADYADQQAASDPRFKNGHLFRHVTGLFAGVPGSRSWRRELTTRAGDRGGAVIRELVPALSREPSPVRGPGSRPATL